jgi:hypothetical protein
MHAARAPTSKIDLVVTERLLAIAVLVHAGRSDLASYALCAPFLMTLDVSKPRS